MSLSIPAPDIVRFFYFDVQHAIATHDWIIEHSGGLVGVRDLGQLQSPLEHIQNDIYYRRWKIS